MNLLWFCAYVPAIHVPHHTSVRLRNEYNSKCTLYSIAHTRTLCIFNTVFIEFFSFFSSFGLIQCFYCYWYYYMWTWFRRNSFYVSSQRKRMRKRWELRLNKRYELIDIRIVDYAFIVIVMCVRLVRHECDKTYIDGTERTNLLQCKMCVIQRTEYICHSPINFDPWNVP